MDIRNINDLQSHFGPKPLNMVTGNGNNSAITKKTLIIGGVCLGVGVVLGCLIYHAISDDK
jgi:hypothetical protein